MNKKKIIIISAAAVAIIALLVALALILGSVFSKKDADTTITVGSATAAVGETVKIPVEFKGNPGSMAYDLKFTYDAEKLECLNAESGNIIPVYNHSVTSGQVTIVGLADEDVKKDGTLVYLNFKVLDGAKGDADIKLETYDIGNFDEELIKAQTENGKIKIK